MKQHTKLVTKSSELTLKRWQHTASTAVTDHEGPRNLLTMPLVIEGRSDPMKDADKLTNLLRSDDLIQIEETHFSKMISKDLGAYLKHKSK